MSFYGQFEHFTNIHESINGNSGKNSSIIKFMCSLLFGNQRLDSFLYNLAF